MIGDLRWEPEGSWESSSVWLSPFGCQCPVWNGEISGQEAQVQGQRGVRDKASRRNIFRELIWVYARWEEESGLGFVFSRQQGLSHLLFLVIMDTYECVGLNMFILGPWDKNWLLCSSSVVSLKMLLWVECGLQAYNPALGGGGRGQEEEEFEAGLSCKGRISILIWDYVRPSPTKQHRLSILSWHWLGCGAWQSYKRI